MAWIKQVQPEVAEGNLADLYKRIAAARKDVAEVHTVQSLHPAALKAHWELYKAIMFSPGSSLSRLDRERIGVVISVMNNCLYCRHHHLEALRRLGESASVRQELEDGEIPTELPEETRALLRWARRTAQTPDTAGMEDIDNLTELGFDDRAILDATLTVAYFSFVNRIVQLLGVQLEPWFIETCGPLEGSESAEEDDRKPSGEGDAEGESDE